METRPARHRRQPSSFAAQLATFDTRLGALSAATSAHDAALDTVIYEVEDPAEFYFNSDSWRSHLSPM
jgi:hypothetical protein